MLKAIIFSTPNCSQCTATETMLKSKNVPFEKVDLTVEHEIADDLREQGFRGLPVVKATNEKTGKEYTWQGFNPVQLQAALNDSEGEQL